MKHFLPTLALLLMGTAAHAQQPGPKPKPTEASPAAQPTNPTPSEDLTCRVLMGRVTDQAAAPLLGASVMLRSQDKAFSVDAFSTNSEGQYMITSKKTIPRNAVLVISAAGYSSYEHPITDCEPLNVTLEVLPGTKFKSDGRIKRTEAAGKIKVRR